MAIQDNTFEEMMRDQDNTVAMFLDRGLPKHQATLAAVQVCLLGLTQALNDPPEGAVLDKDMLTLGLVSLCEWISGYLP